MINEVTAVRRKPLAKGAAGVVAITGASSGIGRATAELFASLGWRVGLIARGEAGLQAARIDVESHGVMAAILQADVTDLAALDSAATHIEQLLGPIDVWVNCAGNGTYGRFLDTPADQFQRVTDVTYLGTVNGTRVALQRMVPRDHGSVVNVCSAVAYHGMPLLSSYSGAKHAVRGFGQSICAELAEDGSQIRLTTIFPPAVNTPFFEHAISHMGRPGRPIAPVYQPETIARAVYLAVVTKRREMPVSFTTLGFSFGVRLVPGLIHRAIQRLGYNGQLADSAAPPIPENTTLFTASDRASSARGAFGVGARSGSVHLRLLYVIAALFRKKDRAVSATPRPAEDATVAAE